MKKQATLAHDASYLSKPARRRFLKAAGAIPITLACQDSVTAAHPVIFVPAAFDATHDSVLIWLWGNTRRRVSVEYGPAEPSGSFLRGPEVELTADTGYIAAIRLSSLTPGTSWLYRVVDSTGVVLSEHRSADRPG